jgi:brefeldin A-inhibited guanine nucleotide-exchange protein
MVKYLGSLRRAFQQGDNIPVIGADVQVGCHSNISVVFFALDSLRQLSMRFLEIDELPHFQFQKDFLRPFEHVIQNTSNITVKDMILQCLNQMIKARADKIKSGWQTMFGVFTFAAREPYGNWDYFLLMVRIYCQLRIRECKNDLQDKIFGRHRTREFY